MSGFDLLSAVTSSWTSIQESFSKTGLNRDHSPIYIPFIEIDRDLDYSSFANKLLGGMKVLEKKSP